MFLDSNHYFAQDASAPLLIYCQSMESLYQQILKQHQENYNQEYLDEIAGLQNNMNSIGKTYGITVDYVNKVQQHSFFSNDTQNTDELHSYTLYQNQNPRSSIDTKSSPTKSTKEQHSNQLNTQNILISSQPSQKNTTQNAELHKDTNNAVTTQPPTIQMDEHKYPDVHQSSFLETHVTPYSLYTQIKKLNLDNNNFKPLDIKEGQQENTPEMKEHKYVTENYENSAVPTHFIGSIESLKTLSNCIAYAQNIRRLLPIKTSIFLKLFTDTQYIVLEQLCGEAGNGKSVLKIDTDIFPGIIQNVYNILHQQFPCYIYFEDMIREYSQTYGLKQWGGYFKQFPWVLSTLYSQNYNITRTLIEEKDILKKSKKEFYRQFIQRWVIVTGQQIDKDRIELYIKKSQKAKRYK